MNSIFIDCVPFKFRRLTSQSFQLLTISIPNTIAINIQIRLLCEDIQQLKTKIKI